MRLRLFPIATVAFLAATAIATSCVDIDADLADIGERIDSLEADTANLNRQLRSFSAFLTYFQENMALSHVVENSDGSITLYYDNGKVLVVEHGFDGTNGRNGSNGLPGTAPVISVAQTSDGTWCWTVDGEWMLDQFGKPVRATARDGYQVVAPIVRINPVSHIWEISTDNGTTWISMGTSADGQNGHDGTPDIFSDVIVNTTEHTVTFILNDGQSFTLNYD